MPAAIQYFIIDIPTLSLSANLTNRAFLQTFSRKSQLGEEQLGLGVDTGTAQRTVLNMATAFKTRADMPARRKGGIVRLIQANHTQGLLFYCLARLLA